MAISITTGECPLHDLLRTLSLVMAARRRRRPRHQESNFTVSRRYSQANAPSKLENGNCSFGRARLALGRHGRTYLVIR